MKVSGRRSPRALLSVAFLTGVLAASFGAAQAGPAGGSASLASLIQAATAAMDYAEGLISLCSSQGLAVSSENALLASGNATLVDAEVQSQPGGNLTAGLSDVSSAMGDFTLAAVDAGTSLQDAGLSPQSQEDYGTLAALNASANQLSNAIDQTCVASGVQPDEASSFSEDCTSARTSISRADSELSTAQAALAQADRTAAGPDLTVVSSSLSAAKADIAAADSGLKHLSSFTYASRGASFAAGPLAAETAAANSTVELQSDFVGWFENDYASFQTLAESQTDLVGNLSLDISVLKQDLSAVSVSPSATSIQSQQQTLLSTNATLVSVSQQAGMLGLPLATSLSLQSAVSAAESSLDAYDQALAAGLGSADSFGSVAVSGLARYQSTFASNSTSMEASATAFSSTLAALQSLLAADTVQFPLVETLGTLEANVTQQEAAVVAGGSMVSSSLTTMGSDLSEAAAASSALVVAVQGASQVEVSPGLIGNVSSVASSEARFLNSSALGSVESAYRSLQADANQASSLAASSSSLPLATEASFQSASTSFIAASLNLTSQTQVTLNDMSGSLAYLRVDLSERTQALESGSSLASQAVAEFDAQQVALGASLAAKASSALIQAGGAR